ncbi:MAG TPA: FmdE family protein [Sulfurovum sp.]
MEYPDFYTKVETIRLYDPLSDFLGAFKDGIIDIGYIDCVKLAGHSCPTVAGAYLMTLQGLKALYPHSLPKRGSIKVSIKDDRSEGVTGVVANIISFITGACDESGFKGVQGNFGRNDLITYNEPIASEIMFTRIDTNESVSVSYDPSYIPADEQMKPLMAKILQNSASDEEKQTFKTLWQKRVEKILLTPESWDKIITLQK